MTSRHQLLSVVLPEKSMRHRESLFVKMVLVGAMVWELKPPTVALASQEGH